MFYFRCLKNKIRFLLFVTLFSSSILHAQEISITIDDPNFISTPLLTPKERDNKIFETLEKYHLKSALFVCGKYIDNPEGTALLKKWNDAGHIIANHSYTHANINTIALAQFIDEARQTEKIIHPYSNFKKIFRYPSAQEGRTLAKRDGFRNFLRENNYLYGGVTIDQLDDYISDRLEKKLVKNPKADLAPYKKYYLEHVWQHAMYYDNLAKLALGRSPKHTLLLHHNLLNALFLDDVIQMFHKNGWKVINASDAFNDPVFQMKPDILPAGEGLIWAIAKETKRYDSQLRYPGEDESYEKAPMDKLGL